MCNVLLYRNLDTIQSVFNIHTGHELIRCFYLIFDLDLFFDISISLENIFLCIQTTKLLFDVCVVLYPLLFHILTKYGISVNRKYWAKSGYEKKLENLVSFIWMYTSS